MSIRGSSGSSHTAIVVVNRATRPDAPPAAGAPRGVEGRSLREGEIAYVRIPSFGDPNNENKAAELVQQFASSPNLIVDVRLNGGGATPQQLIARLMNRQWRTWQQVTPPRSSQSLTSGRRSSEKRRRAVPGIRIARTWDTEGMRTQGGYSFSSIVSAAPHVRKGGTVAPRQRHNSVR